MTGALNKRRYIAIFGRNPLEFLQLLTWGWARNHALTVLHVQLHPALNRIPFIGRYIKYSVEERKICLEPYKGLIYEIHEETVNVTDNFYNTVIKRENKIINYYNRLLLTSKFEAYIKREISNQIFILLKGLHLIRLSDLKEETIVVSRNPINKFVLRYMEEKYGVKYNTRQIFPWWEQAPLFIYYFWLCIECARRGVVINKPSKSYKIAKYPTVSALADKTMKDGMVIDNRRFKASDLLILQSATCAEDEKTGFDRILVQELKININKNIFKIMFFYLALPLRTYFSLFCRNELYFFYYIFLFHRRSFPIEVLMNSYNIKCNISSVNYDDNVTTIILNKYGTKNIIFHWFDLTVFKGYSFAFCAHNIYFIWGNIHYDVHADYTFIDKKVNIGCIFKREYNKAVQEKQRIISQKLNIENGAKIVTFFDNSFDDSLHLTRRFFLEYLKIIAEFCKSNKSVSVLLKPKYTREETLRSLGEASDKYNKIWDELSAINNFIYLDPFKFGFEEALAISDACVSMGLNSPSTVALICGKDALYFDDTGNKYHPFARKYKDIIVFEDKNLLFRQLNNILDGRFNCRDIINERIIRKYDAFKDDNALERLRDNLYALTKEDSLNG